MTLEGRKIGFLGGGAMGEALLTGLTARGVVPAQNLFVSDVRRERVVHLADRLGVNPFGDNVALVREVDIVVLAVKPLVLKDVLVEIAPALRTDQMVVSIAAGVPTSYIEALLPDFIPVVRVMPNTPCLVGEGASAVAPGSRAGREHVEQAMAMFSAVGRVVQVSEDMMDAVTGLSGSGPAYVYLIAEALSDAGVNLGLPRDVSLLLAVQTILGAARMILETGEHPARLKDMVTTPGWTTVKGLIELEKGGLRHVLIRAVSAAAERSRELAESVK